ncbi:MAG: DUF115 domain-containing protein [Clostridiales bacterium]|nr:DUF115 domain-containing protein [Clostridiales bacterium]
MTNKIKASVNARFIQPYKSSHFDKFDEGKKLSRLKDAHKGQRCFFIGNGPSLMSSDLDKLKENNEISFAFNRIYHIFEKTQWRPTYYISQDEKMLEGCKKEVSDMNLPFKFIPIQLQWYYSISIKGATHFNMAYQQPEAEANLLFSDNIAQKIYCASTGMYTAAQMAAYMGFSEIYLIGTDHHFHISKNNSGEIVLDNSVKDYFSDKYNADKDKLFVPNTEKSTFTYVAMKTHCEKRGIKVFNATRGGKLEVFPRIDFDSLF